jgi:hypothetical protein
MTYVRVTENPNMGWSDERKAKFSEDCRSAHADGTWHKKSKKAVSEAISNGLKAATKYRNRSNGQKLRQQQARAVLHDPKILQVIVKEKIEKINQDDQANMRKLKQERIAEKALIEGLQDTVPILPYDKGNEEKVLTQGVEDADRYCTNWEKINSEMREGSDRPAPVEISKMHMDFIMELFDKIEAVFGVRPDVDEFVGSAIESKLQSVKDKLRKE